MSFQPGIKTAIAEVLMNPSSAIKAEIAELLLMHPTEPTIYCDNCGVRKRVYVAGSSDKAEQWFEEGKAAPRWAGGRQEDGTRVDYCKDCKRKVKTRKKSSKTKETP